MDARTMPELFTRFDTFWECSHGAFSLNLQELTILNSTTGIARHVFPCSHKLCRTGSSAPWLLASWRR